MESVQAFELLDTSDGEAAFDGYRGAMAQRCGPRNRLWMIPLPLLAFTLLFSGAVVPHTASVGEVAGGTPGLRCDDCAVAYYAAAACLLAGRPLGDSAYEEVDLYNALMPGNETLRELFALFDTLEFQEGGRCPQWMDWDEERHRCTLPPGVVDARCPQWVNHHGQREGFIDGQGDVCSANLYYKHNHAGWGGLCTCPDGTEYLVSDGDDYCGSLQCDGGEVGHCSKGGIPTGSVGLRASCFPDINASATQLQHAHPLSDGPCWRDRRPLFVLSGFQAGCNPVGKHHSPRSKVQGFMNYAMGLSKCIDCLNWHPVNFKYGSFDVFYAFFHSTRAGHLCRQQFGGLAAEDNGSRTTADPEQTDPVPAQELSVPEWQHLLHHHHHR
eukprot:TRINITY_DN51418_c0_g1_i2.p1 TRINITY_DN51418_c0_g1~~TRINITY_DN51418_c0_g1_i2.p1  ORF type:complete len:441 (+),score=18.36 TRINITY_DN51418_c0_g1_i2:172-1323(+)